MDTKFKFYINLDEPARSITLALHDIILEYDENVSATVKYGMPFFFYKNRRFAYLWIEKKTRIPYIGFTDGGIMKHPLLEQEGRKRMKVLKINPEEDIPLETVWQALEEAIQLCSGTK